MRYGGLVPYEPCSQGLFERHKNVAPIRTKIVKVRKGNGNLDRPADE